MANGIITLGSTKSNLEGRIVWESASNGSSANNSYVAGHLQVRRNDGYTTKGTWTGALRVGGVVNTFSRASTSVGSDWVTMLEFAIFDHPHNDDGTGYCFIEGYCNGPSGTSMAGQSVSGSQTVTLDTIPRASQPSCITWPNTTQHVGNLGDTITIHMNRASGSFTHNVYCIWGNKTITVGTGVTDQVSFTIPKDFADNIPNASSGRGNFSVDTFSGGTMIGTKTVGFTASVPNTSEFQPSISNVSLSEAAEGIAEQFGSYIQNRSKINGKITAGGAYSSTIKSYKTVINGMTYNESTFITDVLKLSGTNSISVSVTDSRGRTAELTKEFEVLAYEGPSITKFTVNRCNSDETLNDEGEYTKVEIAVTIPSLNGKNTRSYNLQYKDTDDTSYTQYAITLAEKTIDTNINLSGSCVIPADSNNSFEYLLTVTDYFISVNKVNEIGTAFQLINFNASGKGLAFGKVSEKDAFEVGMDIYDKFGQLIRNGLAEYGAIVDGVGGNIDADTTLSHLCLTNKNVPNDAPFYYVMTMFYEEKSETANRTQIAIPYILTSDQNKKDMYIRQYVGGTWNEWYSPSKGKALYDNTSGSNGTITLSESADNFSYLEIFYTDNNKEKHSSTKITYPNGKHVDLHILGSWYHDAVRMDIRTREIAISGTSITDSVLNSQTRSNYIMFTGTGITEHGGDAKYIYITKVVGYR